MFSKGLKAGKIIPIFKKGDRECYNNYRLICILPFFSKVVDKLICNHLIKYLSKFNILSDHQFGFRPSLSTEVALITFTDRIKLTIDEGILFGVVFIDFTKAFDTINHAILFHKLDFYGISGPPLQLIKRYLCDRTQVVQINQSFSSPKTTNIGIPQGSILGPLLFLLFINGLPLRLNHTNALIYADDTTTFTAHKDPLMLQQSLNVDLNNVH